ncbi:MAG: histidine kinase N-terminal 7TM domain-containing protein [Dehalococcoidia bacterium]|nr:histidine kinase N-terminal 7TM domain-containing protein [Dehalococcoidia bacterium]MDD5494766.1 histidine kinase N-terminal 7TM domain-containing protein [Dehalococcoidia bacterium]
MAPNPIALSMLIPTAISLALALYAFTRRRVVGARAYAFVMLSIAWWSFTYGLELASLNLAALLFFGNLVYVGVVTMPVLYLILVLLYTGREHWVTTRNVILLFVIPLITLCICFTDQYTHLFYRNVAVAYGGPIPFLSATGGPWFWVHITYSYLASLTGTVLLAQILTHPSFEYRYQAAAILIGAVVPLLANVAFIFLKLRPFGYLEYSPFAFTFAGIVNAWGIFRYRLFDISPVARDMVVESMGDGMVVLDRQNRIVDGNEAAQRFFGWESIPVGKPASPAWDDWPDLLVLCQSREINSVEITRNSDGRKQYTEAEKSPLTDRRGKNRGAVILLRDVTDRKLREDEIRKTNEKLEDSLKTAEQRNREITLLGEMAQWMHSSTDMADAYQIAAQYLAELFKGDSGFLAAIKNENQMVEVMASFGTPAGDKVFPVSRCLALRHSSLYESDGGDPSRICPHLGEFHGCYLSIPLLVMDKPVGLLEVQKIRGLGEPSGSPDGSWLATHRNLLISVGQELSMALANVELRESLREQSIRDPLTGLYNRRHMEDMLDAELHRSRRSGKPVGFIMADLDHFKQFNDTYGHMAGDLLLKAVANLIRNIIRVEDTACRYGGEEFLIILPAAGLQDTYTRAIQIQKEVRKITFSYEQQQLGNMTISMGVASFPDHGNEVPELIRTADEALYRAKDEGRDRVCLPYPLPP